MELGWLGCRPPDSTRRSSSGILNGRRPTKQLQKTRCGHRETGPDVSARLRSRLDIGQRHAQFQCAVRFSVGIQCRPQPLEYRPAINLGDHRTPSWEKPELDETVVEQGAAAGEPQPHDLLLDPDQPESCRLQQLLRPAASPGVQYGRQAQPPRPGRARCGRPCKTPPWCPEDWSLGRGALPGARPAGIRREPRLPHPTSRTLSVGASGTWLSSSCPASADHRGSSS
jgi:hypothetical protein